MPASPQLKVPPRESTVRMIRSMACALMLLLVSGCSSFNGDWKKAAIVPATPGSIEGAWTGSWLSDHNAHTGGLRAIITRREGDIYHARFHATYMKVLSFGQAVHLKVKQDGTNFTFSGSEDLGKTHGGSYSYEGNSSPEAFFSKYDCPIDHGTFQMKRP
jgi:hypothetical protein